MCSKGTFIHQKDETRTRFHKKRRGCVIKYLFWNEVLLIPQLRNVVIDLRKGSQGIFKVYYIYLYHIKVHDHLHVRLMCVYCVMVVCLLSYSTLSYSMSFESLLCNCLYVPCKIIPSFEFCLRKEIVNNENY